MTRALIIVDFQNDFTPGGALAVPEGDQIAGRINQLIATDEFELVLATRDWHPPDHGSFAAHGGPWPAHCVAGSDGAQLHRGLDEAGIEVLIDKGHHPDDDGYSGFQGTDLEALLRDRGVEEATIVGLATDYCVKHTVLDALAAGFRVRIDERAMRGVEVQAGDSERAVAEMVGAGAQLI
jgi:nicotinamidase/pyrazinamidase